jgi:para-nitrobenzyl esterase
MGVVETSLGRLSGAEEGGLSVFRGVPYAQPPTGELRLRGPRPAAPWTGVRTATDFGPQAPQSPPTNSLTGEVAAAHDEDCLTLNIWTPRADGARLPVLLWIHGGGFSSGSGATPLYAGARLAQRGDAVVVTINYRLGILGFLAHPGLADEDFGGAQGNWGLLDQVAALEWIRDNIAAFGGDPANVTIFGESAGAMAVCDLMAMPAARGLFRRAIAQSGPPSATTMERAEEHAAKLMAELGVSDPAQLRTVPVTTLLSAQQGVMAPRAGAGLVFVPVVDGVSIPIDPLTSFVDGSAAPVPLLIGTNRDEAKMFMVADPKNRDPDEDLLLRRIDRAFVANDVALSAERAVDAYRVARSQRGEPTTPRDLWSAIESDRMFRIGSVRAATAHARRQPATYSYLFSWESPAMHGALGACHALEIPFVLGNLDAPTMDRFAGTGPAATALSGQMMDAWLAFARSDSPAHAGLPDWPPYDAVDRSTMIFGPDTHLERAPMDAERALWEEAV